MPLEVAESLEELELSEDTILKHLKTLKPDKSPGPDEIHSKVLRETADAICIPLYLIFKKSMNEGQVPTAWKKANVVPLHKTGRKDGSGNYRPVSLTSVTCKVMEKIVRDKIAEHMEKNELFSARQHGFRSGRSCASQLLEVLET